MAARALPGLGLKGFWGLGYDGWKGEMDINLLVLSVVAGGQAYGVADADPGSPDDGDVWLLSNDHPTNPGGLAIRDAGAWVYVQPPQGLYEDANVVWKLRRALNGLRDAAARLFQEHLATILVEVDHVEHDLTRLLLVRQLGDQGKLTGLHTCVVFVRRVVLLPVLGLGIAAVQNSSDGAHRLRPVVHALVLEVVRNPASVHENGLFSAAPV